MSLAKNYDIDTSLPSTHSLIVKVVDSKGLSATTSVNIEVLDINDNAPQFEGPEFVEFVYSDSLIGSQVQKLSVSDKDSSLNAQLTCSMDSSHAASQFALAGDCTIYQTESLEGMAEGSINVCDSWEYSALFLWTSVGILIFHIVLKASFLDNLVLLFYYIFSNITTGKNKIRSINLHGFDTHAPDVIYFSHNENKHEHPPPPPKFP